jgi:hypothetical protein
LKFNASQQWSKRLETSLNFIFGTGAPITLPKGYFDFGSVDSFNKYNYYTTRNGYRLPNYHRLDFSVRLNTKMSEAKKLKAWWSLDVYNVYARKNPFGIYAPATVPVLEMSYLFTIVPTLSYNLTF